MSVLDFFVGWRAEWKRVIFVGLWWIGVGSNLVDVERNLLLWLVSVRFKSRLCRRGRQKPEATARSERKSSTSSSPCNFQNKNPLHASNWNKKTKTKTSESKQKANASRCRCNFFFLTDTQIQFLDEEDWLLGLLLFGCWIVLLSPLFPFCLPRKKKKSFLQKKKKKKKFKAVFVYTIPMIKRL